MSEIAPPVEQPKFHLTEEHRRKLSESHRNSPLFQAHLLRLHDSLKGKVPWKATASGMAALKLKAMGLDRHECPQLWRHYTELFLRRLLSE